MKKIKKAYAVAIYNHRWCRRYDLDNLKRFPPAMQLFAQYYFCPLSNSTRGANVEAGINVRSMRVVLPDL